MSNAMFFVGLRVLLIVVLCVACNEFIIVDDNGRDGEVGGLFFDFMEGDDADDIDGGCVLDVIDGIDDGVNDSSFDFSLSDMLLNASIIGSLALALFIIGNEQ